MLNFLLIACVLLVAAGLIYSIFASRFIARRRKGVLHYVEIAVLLLILAPLGGLIALFIPTPGDIVVLFPPNEGSLDLILPRLFVAGLINVACCYVIIRALAAVVARARRRGDPARPTGRA